MPENRSPQRPDDLLRPLTGRRAATTVGPDDPAVRDHLVHQVPVLPGVFLLDLVLRTVRRGGIDPGLVELRRIVFRAPVMGTGGRSTVEVGLGEAAEGQPLPVTVRSRPADDPQAPWETNCTAELHRADGRPTRHVDFAALVDTAPRTVAVDDLYGLVRGLDIEHRGFMRASGTVHVGSRHAVARMRLADEAVAHLGDFHAHPAVLDFATLVPMLLLDGHDADGPRPAYIPLYIESFRARTGVAAQNVVHVPGPVGGGLDSELFDADLEICSPTGEVVAELIGFRAKRVRSADLITDRARRPADRPDGAADPTPAAAAVGEGTSRTRSALSWHGGWASGPTTSTGTSVSTSAVSAPSTCSASPRTWRRSCASSCIPPCSSSTPRSGGWPPMCGRSTPPPPPRRSPRRGLRRHSPHRGPLSPRPPRSFPVTGPPTTTAPARSRWPWSVWLAATPGPGPHSNCGRCWPRARTAPPPFRRTAGTTRRTSTRAGAHRGAPTPGGAPSAKEWPSSTPVSSTSTTARPS